MAEISKFELRSSFEMFLVAYSKVSQNDPITSFDILKCASIAICFFRNKNSYNFQKS